MSTGVAEPPPTLARVQGRRAQAAAIGRRWLSRLPRWLAALLAIVLLAGVVAPITDTGMRGDDSHVPIDLNGQRRAVGDTLPEIIWQELKHGIKDNGRPQPLGTVEGITYMTLVPERFPYKLGIALLTLACVLALAWFLRMFRVPRGTLLIIAAAFAMSLQFRQTHDPALGYYSTPQFSLLVLFAGLGAYLRYLRGASSRWYAAAIVLALILVGTYEANQPLVLAFAALHLGRDDARVRRWRAVIPFLGIGAFMTALTAYTHSHVDVPPTGYETSLDLIAVVLTAARQAVSGLPDIYFLSGSNGLLSDPTKAEAVAALWRAALAAVLTAGAFLTVRWSRPTTPNGAPAIAGIGFVLMTCSGLYISLAAQHQQLITLGSGHLATLAGTIGFVMLVVALFVQVGPMLAARLPVIAALAASAFLLVLANQYSNLRVVGVEWPGIQQRELVKQGLDHGVLDGLADGTTVYVMNRDLGWPFGNLTFYGGTADYLILTRTGRRVDVRTFPAPTPACGPPRGFPVSDCARASSRVAWLAVRGSRKGGTVLIADGVRGGAHPEAGATRSITAVTRDRSSVDARAPWLVGNRPNGKPWSATEEQWTREPLGDGWVRWTTTIRGHTGPMAPTINDPLSRVDFTAAATAGQIVRSFGARHLLP